LTGSGSSSHFRRVFIDVRRELSLFSLVMHSLGSHARRQRDSVRRLRVLYAHANIIVSRRSV